MSDPTTGQDYEMLTTDISNKYFNSIKNKLHILGVASIERTIKTENVGKNAFTGKDVIKGSVQEEKRFITFRDDNYNIDSKSRFAEIKPKIKLDANEFINAIQEAIELEHNKQNSGSLEDAKKEQDVQKEKELITKHKEAVEKKSKAKVKDIIELIKEKFDQNKTDASKLMPFTEKFKSYGYTKFDQVETITLEQAEELVKLL